MESGKLLGVSVCSAGFVTRNVVTRQLLAKLEVPADPFIPINNPAEPLLSPAGPPWVCLGCLDVFVCVCSAGPAGNSPDQGGPAHAYTGSTSDHHVRAGEVSLPEGKGDSQGERSSVGVGH